MYISDQRAGKFLPADVLVACTLATVLTISISTYSIWLQLKHYYKPYLQRYVIRILAMPLLYAWTSMISLYSLGFAEIIGLVRDLYEAVVIYCFFNLLVEKLSGESEILTLLRQRPPTPHPFPFRYFLKSVDMSDPYTFLRVKRGIQPTMVLKMAGKYKDGQFNVENGYTWVALIYNVSVFIALYSLTLFWMCLHRELAPFQIESKFLCIKGIIFFTFWQGLLISILVSAGIIQHVGSINNSSYLSTALQDMLICFEMPIFAVGHAYAFAYQNFANPPLRFAGRLPVSSALWDSLSIGDIVADIVLTFRGTDYTYQAFEPNDSVVHHEFARESRSRAGLRYAEQGKNKYWIPRSPTEQSNSMDPQRERRTRPIAREESSLLGQASSRSYFSIQPMDESRNTVRFPSPDREEDCLYDIARSLPYGDYKYPCIGSPGTSTHDSVAR